MIVKLCQFLIKKIDLMNIRLKSKFILLFKLMSRLIRKLVTNTHCGVDDGSEMTAGGMQKASKKGNSVLSRVQFTKKK